MVRKNTSSHANNGKAQTSALETWTPDKAKAQLLQNSRNRPKNENHILELAQAIDAGEWEVNGETIKIASDGELEDGQQRLEAIVLADREVASWTVRGCPVGSFSTIDQGHKRTLAHLFARQKEASYGTLAGASKLVWKYLNKQFGKSGPASRPRPAQSLELLERHPGLRESVSKCLGIRVMPPAQASALHYLFGMKHKERADEFFEQLALGEGLKAGTGVYALREWLQDSRVKGRKNSPPYLNMAYAIIAWNADRSETTLRRIRWIPGTDEFPTIK